MRNVLGVTKAGVRVTNRRSNAQRQLAGRVRGLSKYSFLCDILIGLNKAVDEIRTDHVGIGETNLLVDSRIKSNITVISKSMKTIVRF